MENSRSYSAERNQRRVNLRTNLNEKAAIFVV